MQALGKNDLLLFGDLFRIRRKVRTRVIALGGLNMQQLMYSSGMKLSLGQAVDAWRVQQATLINAPSFGTLDCLRQIADVTSYLLRQCKGSAKLLTFAVGPQTLALHVDVRQVGHWFGEVKKFHKL